MLLDKIGFSFVLLTLQSLLQHDLNNKLVMILAETVDDIRPAGLENLTSAVIDKINDRFSMGSIARSFELLHFFGFKIVQ